MFEELYLSHRGKIGTLSKSGNLISSSCMFSKFNPYAELAEIVNNVKKRNGVKANIKEFSYPQFTKFSFYLNYL